MLNRKSPLKSKKRLVCKTVSACKSKAKRGERLSVSEAAKLTLEVWSKLVRAHAKGKCEWCGKPATQAHHMRAKAGGNALRFDLCNGVALCYGCHVEFHQKDSLKGWLLFEQQRPTSYQVVKETTGTARKLTVEEILAIKADLERQLEDFEA